MNPRRFNIQRFNFFGKIILSAICYFGFTFYTIPLYQNIRAFVDEKFITNKKTIVVAEELLTVEVVDTDEKRTLGLSGRLDLPLDTGMLFIFQENGIHNFWMKDMNFDIDIVWFNQYGEVIYFVENATPKSYPKLLGPAQSSMFILEVPAGYIKSKGLKLGDKIDLY